MADSFTTNLNLRKPEVGHADDTWGGTNGLNSDLDIIDTIFAPDGSGPAVGLHVGAGKTLKVDGSGQVTLQNVTVQDPTDATKKMLFATDALPTGTIVSVEAPPASGTMATREYLASVLASLVPTGSIQNGYYGTVAPTGWTFADGRTIGSATSGATNRANADTQALYAVLWNFNDNTRFPVIGGRGASALVDWAANKPITLPDHSGRVMAGRDDLSGTSRALLSTAIPLSTTRGAPGGSQTGAVSVGVSGSIGGSATGNISGTTDSEAQGYVAAAVSGAGAAMWQHQHAWRTAVNLGVSGSFSGSGTGSTLIVQPTIMVDVVIKL